jgi:uncharacterized heparinase superfamily protein
MIGDMLRGARRMLANLKPIKVPDGPARAFRDLWPGDAARGARLLRGEYEVMGTVRPLRPAEADGAADWAPGQRLAAWRAAAHGFAWLRDLRALGTDAARLRGRALAADWLAAPARRGGRGAGSGGRAHLRLARPLGLPRRDGGGRVPPPADDAARRRCARRGGQPAGRGRASRRAGRAEGRHGAAVALEEETWLARCVRFLPAELERQFNADGGHVERSPAAQLGALQDLIEIRNLLHGAGSRRRRSWPACWTAPRRRCG